MLLPIIVAGCQRPSSPYVERGNRFESNSERGDDEYFDLAMEFLNRMDEYNSQQATMQVLYNLNRWLESRDSDAIVTLARPAPRWGVWQYA